MAISLKNALLDAQISWEMGVDTYQAPSRVPRNQLCLSINNSTRQDYISPRPRWRQVPLTFVKSSGGSIVPAPDVQTAFETGYFQKFSGYVPDQGPSHLIWCISGQVFKVDALTGGNVQKFPLPTPRPINRPNSWLCQAEMFLVIQDGKNVPLIYDGATLRLSDVLGSAGVDADGHRLFEVPVGSVMAYSDGRLWVALENNNSFAAGDIVYGPTGTAAYNRRDSVLKFTENTYLNEGFAFAVPANMGGITAMIPVANLDTSLGQGPLQIFTPQGCFSVQAPADRDTWKNLTYPIKTVSLFDNGALSDVATVNVNGDVWYRAPDGARSFLIARRDFGTWGNRSMSYEVIRHLKNDDPNLLYKASAAVFDNRLLMTCAPQYDAFHGVYHRGLVVLDFIPLTSIGGSQPPNWDGLWTSTQMDILQIQRVESEGVSHCFAAVLAQPDDQGLRKIQLWELDRNPGPDLGPTLIETRVTRRIETPRLDFAPASNRLEQKLLEAVDIWASDVKGLVNFSLWYRPDEDPCWKHWRDWEVCAPVKTCASDAVNGCVGPMLNRQAQYRARMGALKPPESLSIGRVPSRMFYGCQFALDIVGEATISAMRFLANRIVEPVFGSAQPTEASCEEIIQCCPVSDFPPIIPGGSGGGGGGEGSGGGPAPPQPPPDPADPTGGYPIVNGWTADWLYKFQSTYGMTKSTDSLVTDGMTAEKAAFWATLITNEWNVLPPGYTERTLGWDFVDPNVTNIGDFDAKFATGNPAVGAPDEPPLYSPGAFWVLCYFYR